VHCAATGADRAAASLTGTNKGGLLDRRMKSDRDSEASKGIRCHQLAFVGASPTVLHVLEANGPAVIPGR